MFHRSFFTLGSTALLASFDPFEIYGSKETGIFEIVVANKKNSLNLLDNSYFTSLIQVTQYLSKELNDVARVAILTSKEGTCFSAGLDLTQLMKIQEESSTTSFTNDKKISKTNIMPAMKFQKNHAMIRYLQNSVSSLIRCRIPIICAIDGHCIGGATSIITACDFRYATEKASFSVKEVQVGLAPDLGVLQRLPNIVGEGRARELIFTARSFNGKEAKKIRLVEEVFSTREEMMKAVREVAAVIAANSPLAVQGSKFIMNRQVESNIENSLEYTASWSGANILCDDVIEAATAFTKKSQPHFKNFMVDSNSTVPPSRK